MLYEGCTSSQFVLSPSLNNIRTLTHPRRSVFGDLTNGCNSTGLHYNPHNVTHGGPKDDEGHVGDLGNIQADDKGVACIDIWSSKIRLDGPTSVLG
jgi:Cu/Zn superoxide dismutase